MGTEFPISVKIPVCQPPGTDGQGAGDYLPRHRFSPDRKGGAHPEDSANRCGDAHPTIRTVRRPGCAESQSERGPVHFHMLFLDGVFTDNRYGKTRFRRTIAPNQHELTELLHLISHRIADFLERRGILERDEENSYLNLEGSDQDPMQQVLGCSVSYRIAIGPQQGRKVFA